MDTPSSELFFPGILNDLNATTSRIIVFNTDKAADATATVAWRARIIV